MKMKIKTNRVWQLELEDREHSEITVSDTLDLRELHDHAHENDSVPYIVIPIESVDTLILKLLQYKKRYMAKMNVEIDWENDHE